MYLYKFTAIICFLVSTVICLAQENEWVHHSPSGADVVDIAINIGTPHTFIAAAGTPYIRESDNSTWEVLSNLNNLISNGITSIEANQNGSFFAGGIDELGVVFKSIDGGETWEIKPLPVDNGVLNIIFDPIDNNTVYLTTTSTSTSTTNHVILKSIDNGETWIPFDMTEILPPGLQCTDLAVDTNNNQNLVALGDGNFSYDAKVIRSTDGGISWIDITGSLPVSTALNDVKINNGSIFVSGGHHFSGNFGIYQSNDNGNTWINISEDFPLKIVNELTIHPSNNQILYAATEGEGIYTSTNGGISWDYNSTSNSFNGACRKVVFNPANMTIHAAYIGIGVAQSLNGNTWTAESDGMNDIYLNDIQVDNNNGVILAAYEGLNSGGCFLYHPNTQQWQPVKQLPACRFSKVDIGSDGVMYAWSLGPTKIAQEGLYKSIDGGETWTNMGPDLGEYLETEINALSISPSDPNLIFIAGNNFGANGWDAIIYKSVDGGETWENSYQNNSYNSFRDIHIDHTSNNIVYAAYNKSSPVGGFIKSTDGGNTWNEINNGIASTTKWSSCITTSPSNSSILYSGVGGSSGITRTVYKSIDSGNTWSNMSLPSGENFSKISAITIHPTNPDLVYVSTSKDGIYMTQDGGSSWSEINNGLLTPNIARLSNIYSNSEAELIVYAASYGNGAFKQSISTMVNATNIDDKYSHFSVYPNPASNYIQLDIDSYSDFHSVNIYSLEGHLLYQLPVDHLLDQQLIDVTHLPPGIYTLEVLSDKKQRVSTPIIISPK